MPYCVRCGVELDAHVRACPLCRTNVPELPDVEASNERFPSESNSPYERTFATKHQIRQRVFFILVGIFFVPATILAALDLTLSHRLSWSLIPIEALFAVLAGIVLVFRFSQNAYVVVTAFASVVLAFMLSVDATITGSVSWSFSVAFPIVASLAISTLVSIFVLSKWKIRGYNVVGFVLTVASLACLEIDVAIHVLNFGTWTATWSLVVALSIFPIACFFLYLHFGLRRTLNLKQFFHI